MIIIKSSTFHGTFGVPECMFAEGPQISLRYQ